MNDDKPTDDKPAPLTAEERQRRIQAAIDRDGAEVVWARLMRVLNDKDFDR